MATRTKAGPAGGRARWGSAHVLRGRVEHMHAAAVLKAGATTDADGLAAHVAAVLSPKHVPAVLTLHDDLPLTGAGKPDEQSLAARTTGAA